MKQIKRCFFALVVLIFALSYQKVELKAASIVIQDEADLLSEAEEKELYVTMEEVSTYGGVAFISNPSTNYIASASGYAEDVCRELFKGKSGTVFLIDMYNRRIEIYSTGEIYRKITKQRANIITDNCYEYATDKEYFECANEIYTEMLYVLEGGNISTPLKYLSNILMAFGISTIALYLILYAQRRPSLTPAKTEAMNEVYYDSYKNVHITRNKMLSRRKSIHVESSGGSGSGYSGGSSGGGGGSSSGGGGGHSF